MKHNPKLCDFKLSKIILNFKTHTCFVIASFLIFYAKKKIALNFFDLYYIFEA